MTISAADDERYMTRALEIAARGEGRVEPNPMVGCVLVQHDRIVAEGWHQEFGGPHAEIVALQIAGPHSAPGATAYVTLEPCCHQGKTPPCTKALIHARVARVVAAMEDPFPPVDGSGIDELRAAGIDCEIGLLGNRARELNAPYLKRLLTGRSWVIAKWAQTSDGQLAMPPGGDRWISNDASREIVQELRGRVDIIVVGIGTVRADDPLLTARPANKDDIKRVATRVVIDSLATLPMDSQLVKTAREVPVLVATSAAADVERCRELVAAGVDVWPCAGVSHAARFDSLLDELGRRKMTNVLVEGGSRLLNAIVEMDAVDEIHVFKSSKVAGATASPAPNLAALKLKDAVTTDVDGDTYLRARIAR